VTTEAGDDNVAPSLGVISRTDKTYGGYVKTCDFCGKQAEDEATTLTWSVAVENGQPRTFCDTCSREHLRAMESQLDSEWW
jgi:hypothetical protein